MPGPEPPQPLDPAFRIELPRFEGPLDLLLHLVRTHDLDILDLPIAFVTERYLQYVALMEQLDLDVASEYLVMAAELVRIKSRMLLPPDEDDEQDAEGEEPQEDPRAELVRRLLEYQKYKQAGEQLAARGLMGRDVFGRGAPPPEAAEEASPRQVSVFALLEALQRVLERARADLSFEIDRERIGVQERIAQLLERLEDAPSLRFEALFEGAAHTDEIIVTFLALLEMAKRRMVWIRQQAPHAPILVVSRLGRATAEDGLAEADPGRAERHTGAPRTERAVEAEDTSSPEAEVGEAS